MELRTEAEARCGALFLFGCRIAAPSARSTGGEGSALPGTDSHSCRRIQRVALRAIVVVMIEKERKTQADHSRPRVHHGKDTVRQSERRVLRPRGIMMKTAYINGFILDGTADMQPRRGTVLVENGRIAEILSPDALLPADCGIRDLQGGFLMPGLINMHVHLNSGGKPSAKKKEPEDYVRLVKLATSNSVTAHLVRTIIRGFAESQLRSGVTTIRTVGGILASGDQFIGSDEKKAFIQEHFHAIACDMEGGAIGQVCYQNRVPFCVLRAISDSADGSSQMDYKAFIEMAAAQSVRLLYAYIRA